MSWFRGPAYVTYDGVDGLANRLRLHFLANAYALRTKRRLITQWIRNQNCYAVYHDLFEGGPTEYERLNFVERYWLRRLRFHPRYNDCRVFPKGTLPDCQGVESLPDVPQRLVHLAADLETFIERGSRLGPFEQRVLASLIPRAEIRDAAERFQAGSPHPRIGVHVRMGDFIVEDGSAAPPFPGAFRVPLARFSDMLRQARNSLPQACIVIVSDGREAELQPLLSEFGCRLRQRRGERDSLAGMQEALVDLLVLATCDVVIGTPYSSFSSMGAFIGHKPLVAAFPVGWENQLDQALSNIA